MCLRSSDPLCPNRSHIYYSDTHIYYSYLLLTWLRSLRSRSSGTVLKAAYASLDVCLREYLIFTTTCSYLLQVLWSGLQSAYASVGVSARISHMYYYLLLMFTPGLIFTTYLLFTTCLTGESSLWSSSTKKRLLDLLPCIRLSYGSINSLTRVFTTHIYYSHDLVLIFRKCLEGVWVCVCVSISYLLLTAHIQEVFGGSETSHYSLSVCLREYLIFTT